MTSGAGLGIDWEAALCGREPISEVRQASEVTFSYEVPRALLEPRVPAGADENWTPDRIA